MQLCFWLMPCEAERAFFAGSIARLAKRFGAPEFAPHVTIHAAPHSPQDPPEALIAAATAGTAPFALQPAGIGHSSRFTKTFFLEFEPSPLLTALHDRFRAGMARPSNYTLQPHLSLLYHRLEEAGRLHLVREFDAPARGIVFDAVAAVLAPDRIESAADVACWRVVARQKLPASG
jgi:2'-5' RNA ligase